MKCRNDLKCKSLRHFRFLRQSDALQQALQLSEGGGWKGRWPRLEIRKHQEKTIKIYIKTLLLFFFDSKTQDSKDDLPDLVSRLDQQFNDFVSVKFLSGGHFDRHTAQVCMQMLDSEAGL